MKQEDLETTVLNYAKIDNAICDNAILIDGEWGSGKTYFWKNALTSMLVKSDYKILYISIFGISSEQQIYDQLFTGTIVSAASKILKKIVRQCNPPSY